MSGYFRSRLGEYEYFIPQSNYDIRVTLMGKMPRFVCKKLIHQNVLTALFWLAMHSGRYSLGDGKLTRERK